jgi:hypothetical protein
LLHARQVDRTDLSDVCARLAGEVAKELDGHPGKRWRCPRDLRSRIVSYARVCRERGEPVGDISRRLGLVESTVARWLRADRAELQAGFRSVSIVAAEECGHGEAGASLRLITPRGYSVEGLDAQALAFLLRVVG